MAFVHSPGRRYALATGAVVFLAVLTIAGSLAAETLTLRLLIDCRDGRLDEIKFSTAALIASGVEDESELADWTAAYAEHSNRVLNRFPEGPDSDRLRAIHAEMQATILTGSYRISATDLRLALSEGDFNCLSSVAIYFDLCRSAGVELEIWLARGHVYLKGNQECGISSIEPESPVWGEATFAARPGARRITPVELLGKFYYNRGVQMLRDRRFAEGVELLKVSLTLDPADADARANLAAGFNNWAAEQCARGRYSDAASLIQRGLEIEPAFAPLIANERLVRGKLSY